ncbi:MAG: hypothetical protein HKN25_13355, partial [Pyrinomonadaceae bacterium]|nr:hypothetical protein [Pyrinomonadaceae bacterium]
MIRVISFRALLIISLLSSSVFAQHVGGVKVSPTIDPKIKDGKCRALKLGRAAFSKPPKYPNDAVAARIGGTVNVNISIDKDGYVTEVRGASGPE